MKKFICSLCTILCLLVSVSVCTADESENDPCDEEVSLMEFADEGSEEESTYMYVSGRPFVRLRQTDSTKQPYVDKMLYGSMVTVISSQINVVGEEWSLVNYNEKHGYCMTKYLSDVVDMSASETCPSTMEEAFDTTLLQRRNNSPSDRVKNLQLFLIKGSFLNDDHGADGYFGKNTYNGVMQ